MTDQAERRPEQRTEPATTGSRSVPVARGETTSQQPDDYRSGLRSRRWQAAPLRNPEVEKTDPRIAVLAIVVMSAFTLAVLLLGYGVVGLWSLPV